MRDSFNVRQYDHSLDPASFSSKAQEALVRLREGRWEDWDVGDINNSFEGLYKKHSSVAAKNPQGAKDETCREIHRCIHILARVWASKWQERGEDQLMEKLIEFRIKARSERANAHQELLYTALRSVSDQHLASQLSNPSDANPKPASSRTAAIRHPMSKISLELEKARKHLLDLTTRNRLLSLPQTTRSKTVTIDDELSKEILRMLVLEQGAFGFLPVPEDEDDEEPILSLEDPDEEDVDERGIAARHRDTWLQTKLSAEKLESRLLGVSTDARTGIEEQGVNTLYLALGQLKWQDARDSSKDRFAPLILIPVELKRSSAQANFKLRALDQDPSDNLSLTEKLKEFGIVAPDFEWGDEFSITDYFNAYQERIAAKESWEILPDAMILGFFSFSKFLMFRDLDPDNWPGAQALEQHALVDGLMGEGFSAPEPPLPEDQHLDELVPVEKLSHVVDADSSQALAIEEVRRGQNLIIQGPPGTGKSQTITNLIATAVLDGKTVLFVAEKLAALEVVSRRLDEIGLGPLALELHSHKTNKRSVLEELKRTLDLGKPRFSKPQAALTQLETARGKLNEHSSRINESRQPHGLPAIDVLGHLSRLQAEVPDSEAIPRLSGAEDWTPHQKEERRLLLQDLFAQMAPLGQPSNHPWYGTGNTRLDKFETEEVVSNAAALREELGKQLESGQQLSEALSVSAPDTLGSIGYYIDLARIVGTAPDMDPAAIGDSAWTSSREALKALVDSGRAFAEAKDVVDAQLIPTAWETDLSSVRTAIAAHGGSFFKVLKGAYREAIVTYRSLLKDAGTKQGQTEQLALLDSLATAKVEEKRLLENGDLAKRCFGDLWQGRSSDWKKLSDLVDWVDQIIAEGHDGEFIAMVSRVQDRGQCAQLAKDSEKPFAELKEALVTLTNKLQLDLQRAFGVPTIDAVTLTTLQQRIENWAEGQESLSKWMSFQLKSEAVRTQGLGALMNFIEHGGVSHEQGEAAFLFAYFRQVYQALMQQEPQLNNFDGESQDQLVQTFRQSDQERIAIARYEVLQKHHAALPSRMGAAGALGVLLGEMKRKRGHMPIRKLLINAGPAVQAIKPVFMMSPLSVAQFLAPGAVEFDLVVFDEASQVEPVDALGAIARAKQLVVVGDDRQLPPTRFFAGLAPADDEDDDGDGSASAGDIESVLGLAESKGLPGKMLRWHYRSRHDSLIAVSNAEFYDHRLFIIPSPAQKDERLGLKFHHVAGGVFDRGKSGTNRIEARAVAEAVMRHAKAHPEESLGVAAFSVSQRDAIIDELELLRKDCRESEAFFRAHPYEPFFVKNLENVQGDERDVIYISVGYAPDETGFFGMNFGPLNRDGGERRLNVLISRAKCRCEVFSSIEAEQIDTRRSNKRGVVALKSFLSFAQNGVLGTPDTETGREVESPFESAVKKALEQHGYEVVPQVGTAGFFIDLAVVDPDSPGRFLIGIECDGATYHSARSARERDRQRQAVLEHHGWTIHRIWSTDWFLRPEEQTKRTIEAIEEARRAQPIVESIYRDIDDEFGVAREEAQVEVEADDDPSYQSYEEANFQVDTRSDLHTAPLSYLEDIVEEIVRIESPIHIDEVVTRLRMLWGLGRTGNRIKQAVGEAVRNFIASEHSDLSDPGFVQHRATEVRVRDRSDVSSATLRKPEYLPPAEIDAAILELAVQNHGLVESEIPKVVSDALGFSSLSQNLRSVIEPRIQHLIETQRLERSSSGLIKASTSS